MSALRPRARRLKTKPRDGAVWSLRRWWLLAAAVLAVGLAAAIWYLRRPLPPPRISRYTQITHDGHEKVPVGTDGSRLYFNQNSPVSIAQVGIAGGEIVQIPVPVPFLTYFDDVSPDGSNFLLETLEEGSHSRELWNVRIPEVRFAAWVKTSTQPSPPMENPSFTPRWKATSTSFGAMGPKLTNWPRSGGNAGNFAWSPDGGQHPVCQDDKLWEMSSNGSNLHQLLPGWHPLGGQCCGRWTPDGKFFVFLSGESGWRGSQIWALDERRGLFRRPPAEPVQLTTGPLSWSKPIPGKDGKSIFAAGTVSRGRTLPLRRNGQTVPALPRRHFRPGIDLLQRRSICGLCLLPRRYPLEGKPGWKQPDTIERPSDRCLSCPVGRQTAPRSCSRTSSSESEIYIVSAEGGVPRKLLPEGSGKQSDPDWSPDGHKVVFGSSFGAHDPKGADTHFRPRQPEDRHSSRIGWHDRSALVSRRPVHRRTLF